MLVKSLGGSLYYVTFIDEFSRKTWIYLLKTKDEVFNKFQEFKAKAKNSTGRKIKILRSDNGGEYTSKELVSFCKKVGIKSEQIVPYNPQQNGVAERKNRSIEEFVKAMMHDLYLSLFLWAEASRKAVYTQNRSPHKVLEGMIPEEAFFRRKTKVGYMIIFVCPVYIHVPKD